MPIGALYSFTDTGNNKRSISDTIYNIDWMEAPLLQLFGFSEANVSKFNIVNWPALKVELLEDTLPLRETTLSAGINDSTLDWPVATGMGQLFRTGDLVVLFLDGQVREKAVVDFVVGDTLTVKGRGYGTTTAQTHSSGATIRKVTRLMPENAPYTTGPTTLTTQPWNSVQILSEAVELSKSAQVVTKYGINDYLDYQVSKLFDNGGSAGILAQMLQNIFYYGERVERNGSNDGSAGGFETFVQTHVIDKAGDPVDKTDIHAMLRRIRQSGGRCDYLVAGAYGQDHIAAMFEDSIRTTRDEKIGGNEITSILTPHGQVKLVYDWMCPPDRYYFTNSAKLGWLPMRPFEASEVELQSDGWAKDVVGEYTFLVCNEKSHGYIMDAYHEE